MLDGRVGQTDDYILAANLRAARTGQHRADHDSDRISDQITERIAHHPGQPVSVWLGQLRRDVIDGVVDRLLTGGVLREVRARRWWGGSSVEYNAVEPNEAMGPEARLFGLMRNRGADTSLDAVLLAGLVDATGLREKLPAWELPAAEVKAMMSRLRAGLPAPLHSLLADVETSVGAALLSTGHH